MEIPRDWTFQNKEVADKFDYHVREQLPWYEIATGLVAHIVRHYLPENGLMYDIGASTGNLECALGDLLQKRKARYVPIDNSEQMAELYRGNSRLQVADAVTFDYEDCDVAVCFLVLMFLSTEQRLSLLKELQKKIKKGGCLIIIDKTQMCEGYLSTVLHRVAIAGKVAANCPADEIIAKELSLAGVQRPLPIDYIERNLEGSHEVFRFGEFAGWVLECAE